MIPVGYIVGEAEGAWPNGSKVRKVNSQPDDGTPNGTAGTVISSVNVSSIEKAATYGYFVTWEIRPDVPVFVADTNNDGTPRLELAE